MITTPSFRYTRAIEILESRIAPASLVFTDLDGDVVTILTSKGSDGDLTAAAHFTVTAGKSHLDELDLRAAIFAGTNLSILATSGGAGDGKADLGFLNAAGRDLGMVTIAGELDQVNAGDAKSSSAAIKSLTVDRFGGAAIASDSDVVGGITTLAIKGDFTGAYLRVRGSDADSDHPRHDADGRIGTLTIDGSLVGTARNNGGFIDTTGDIKTVTVTGSIKGFIDPKTGGTAADDQIRNGSIFSGGKITTVTVGTDAVTGDLRGGDGERSGQITGIFGITTLTIKGNVQGGAGLESGSVVAGGTLKTATIVGDLAGGGGVRSGALLGGTTISSVKIGGDIHGGEGASSGAIGARGAIGTVVVIGDVIGGDGASSGQIVSQATIQNVTVGNLVGGSDFESGAIGSLKGLGTILIKGNIVAGTGTRSGIVATEQEQGQVIAEGFDLPPASANAPIGSVTVSGSIFGNGQQQPSGEDDESDVGYRAGSIIASGQLGPVVVHGNVVGGDNTQTGWIGSSKGVTSVIIDGSLVGGGGSTSGAIAAGTTLGSVKIGAFVPPRGQGEFASAEATGIIGGDGFHSGSVIAPTIARVDVYGGLHGGSGSQSGIIRAADLNLKRRELASDPAVGTGKLGPVFVLDGVFGGAETESGNGDDSGVISSTGTIASVTIGQMDQPGSGLNGSSPDGSGSIVSGGNMGAIKIFGSITGGSGDHSGGITSGGKIASLSIGGVNSVGSLIGGTGNYFSTDDTSALSGQVVAKGAIGPVTITGGISTQDGGEAFSAPEEEAAPTSGAYAGVIHGFSIASVTISGAIAGGAGMNSAGLLAEQNIGPVTVANVSGGLGQNSGYIVANGNLSSVKIQNALAGGNGSGSGYIAAGGTLSLLEAGTLAGGANGNSRPRVSAGKLISTVTINVSITDADILAGYAVDGSAVNPDAQIGTVKVGTLPPSDDSEEGPPGGRIIGANIIAGIARGQDGLFGTSDDAEIASETPTAALSKIAAVIVSDSVNSGGTLSHYGVIAQNLVFVKVGGNNLTLKSGASNDLYTDFPGSGVPIIYGELPQPN